MIQQDLFTTPTQQPGFPTFRLSESANRNLCAKCKSAVWSLLSGGFTTHLDPEPVEAMSRLLNHLRHHHQFIIRKSGNSFQADLYIREKITKDDGTRIVLASHICIKGNIRVNLPDLFPTIKPIKHEMEPGF